MKAIHLGENGLALRNDLPRPRPAAGEALIRLRKMGICSTDLELAKGYLDFHGVLGHEFVGEVETADDDAWIGRRVVGTINLGCGQCRVCAASGPEHCPRRKALGIAGKDGAFAEYLTLPRTNLLEVPAAVPDEAAVFTEPLAAALRIREQIPVSPRARLAVVGPGRLGLLVAQVLALAGNRLTVLGRRDESLALPRRLGLETGLVHEQDDDSYDLVTEATGNEAGLAESLRLVRPLGTLVLKSTFAGRSTVDLSKLVVGEIRVVGSRCGPFEPALRLLAADSVSVSPLVDGEYPLKRGLEAFEHAARPGVRKILLHP